MLVFIITIIWLISYIAPKGDTNYTELFYFKNVIEPKSQSVEHGSVPDEPENKNIAIDSIPDINDVNISVDASEYSEFIDKDAKTVLDSDDVTPSAFAKSIYEEL